jgi:hypothetical protein
MRAFLFLLAVAMVACTPPTDDPSSVKDLRAISLTFSPPDVLLEGCSPQLIQSLAGAGGFAGVNLGDPNVAKLLRALGQPVEFSALIADPKGDGRSLSYQLYACANTGDRECDNASEYIELKRGEMVGGMEVKFSTALGTTTLADRTPLLQKVITEDRFRGLGGIRMPVVLRVQAPGASEQIFAQKLMVYTCPVFPEQKANVQPALPGLTIDTKPWDAEPTLELKAGKAYKVEPTDFTALEESYLVPSLQLQPVPLQESWKIAWSSTAGTISPNQTGGIDFAGQPGRNRVTWTPTLEGKEPREATFYAVVRDGRGGQSVLIRTARIVP